MREVKQKNNLLELRRDVLEAKKHGVLRPHGKMFGMDVFSWHNPVVDYVVETIHAFPYQIVLVGNDSLINEVVALDTTSTFNIKHIICYDKEDFKINCELECYPTIFKHSSHSTAFIELINCQQPKTIVLVLSEGEDGEAFQKAFTTFLGTNQ